MLVTMHVDTERGWRGGEQQVLWLSEAIERQGARALIAARGQQELARRARVRGLQVVDCDPAFELSPLCAARLRRSILRHRVHIVHAHTAHATALAALAISGTGARLVISRHVEFPLKRNFVTRWKYERARAIIAVSAAASRGLIASRVDPERIAMIPGGVDLSSAVAPASEATWRSLGAGGAGPRVVMVAALTAEKEPLVFVRAIREAAAAVPGLQTVLVGEGDQRPAVEAAIRDWNLTDTVHLAGFRADADQLMAGADMVALSSRSEGGMSVALLQAMACGRPVAATAAGGVTELIESEVCGLLVPVGDHQGLGRAIARILNDRDFAARLSEKARERARRFSIDVAAASTLEVYRKVLAA